jgi:hypothetical protein
MTCHANSFCVLRASDKGLNLISSPLIGGSGPISVHFNPGKLMCQPQFSVQVLGFGFRV